MPKKPLLYGISTENLKEAQDIWLCPSCHRCSERCTYGFDPAGVINAFKQHSYRKGFVPTAVKQLVKNIVDTGYSMEITRSTTKAREKLGLAPIEPVKELKSWLDLP
jgi:heterodisulfide reductase subunit C